ncbi:hypothetical protein CC2G_001539 [Coprinopsis cinerea AmutBmut pab1-1]|nr:hypothetical protein CC2G_004923 [Coprinopsis cinerea AmutBmut pab1-1]KAG2023938.1 hypothetical protein CC2G_001539 [Coprinopsis cinerea AmutBmut pab1-1]
MSIRDGHEGLEDWDAPKTACSNAVLDECSSGSRESNPYFRFQSLSASHPPLYGPKWLVFSSNDQPVA